MRFRKNSQEENRITPNVSGVREKIEKRLNMTRKTVTLLPATQKALQKMGGKY